MTSKERVLIAFSNQEPDRVPINYFDNPGIHSRILKHYGLSQSDDEGLLQILNVDFRGIDAPYKGKVLFQELPGIDVHPVWGFRRKWMEHVGGGYLDFCDFPLKDFDEEQVEAWPMPSPDDFDYIAALEQCKRNSKYAVFWGNTGLFDIINTNGIYRSMEQTLIDLALEDPAALLLADRRLNLNLEITYRILEKAKGMIDFIWMGEDLGTQIAPMISPDIYRSIIKPRHKKLVDLAKSYNIPVMIHCCGSSSWAFDDFIDVGINVVDTLQPEAANMSPSFLKKKFGGKLAFHGCISTTGALTYGSEQEVIENVKEIMDIMKPGGGFCLAPTHWIQNNTPVENIISMYKAAIKYGYY